MTELMHFQPGKALYDAYQQGRGNYLAGQAFNSQGDQRQSALGQLAGLNPDKAMALKADFDEQDKADFTEFSNVILNAPEELKPQIYAKGVQRFGHKIRALGVEPPTDYRQALPLFQQLSQAAGGKPKARSSHILADGTIAFMDEYGNLTKTGEKASNTYGFQTDAEGNVYAQDKRGGTVAPAPMGSVQQGMPQVQAGADPMAGGLDRINQGVQVLKSNGVPVEKINEWADNEFAKLQGSVQQGVVEQAPAQARVAVKPDAPKGYTRVMTPQEVAAAGLPQGTSAQVNEATGAISVLNKPAVEPKKQVDANIVKQAAQLPALMRRVQRVMDASKNLGFLGVDGGKLDQYALYWSESRSELESAVGQLRATLLPFVRVPGVGSQSDLEARLDGLQYPDASQPPAVRARNIAELQKFIADLSRVYSAVIKGEQGGGQAPVQVRNADDYNRLPPGTQYIDPTGKQRVKK